MKANHKNSGFLIDIFHFYLGDGNLERLKKIPADKLYIELKKYLKYVFLNKVAKEH